MVLLFGFFSSRRRHTRYWRDWSSDVCSSDLEIERELIPQAEAWGRALGCLTARIDSRDGWERVMRGHGYERLQTVIRKRSEERRVGKAGRPWRSPYH